MDYRHWFNRATGLQSPYPYQERLATRSWPELLDVPTGLGKTAGVVLAWLYKRRELNDPQTPRRLVYCLPMRVLVEQTHRNVVQWLENLELLGEPGQGKVSVHLLMGGERDSRWAAHPEGDAVLIGTQDMLLSRALMRGYGMSRYQWPVHFALLHNDALWVYDEVQLMDAGLATSAQLEAFRRKMDAAKPAHSLWISATLNRDWLATVDMAPHLMEATTLKLDDEDLELPEVRARRGAVKVLHPSTAQLDMETAKCSAAEYVTSLAEAIRREHRAGTTTLVILNRVDRAQALYKALADSGLERLLIHARFRPHERRKIEAALRDGDGTDRVVVATQAVEAGVDISSATLFTELAPWASLVQRFGRCNRHGEHKETRVFWINIETEGDKTLPLPYQPHELEQARQRLEALGSASPAELPAVTEDAPLHQVLRRREFVELFNTDPDLSGYDIDVSPYIRSSRDVDVQVFWHEGLVSPEVTKPARDELCSVSLTQIKAYLNKTVKKHKRSAQRWDPLSERWVPVSGNQLRPGLILLLDAGLGGYDLELGFEPSVTEPVSPVPVAVHGAHERHDEDKSSMLGRCVLLDDHLRDAERAACELVEALDVEEKGAVVQAALWHDAGKAHPAFQNMLRMNMNEADACKALLWAKSDNVVPAGRVTYPVCDEDRAPRLGYRPRFRHELASMLAWLMRNGEGPDADLVAYLIAAHHGKVRLGLRALPDERGPSDEGRFARGIWEGDTLPGVETLGLSEIPLSLELMELGEGALGPSWTARTHGLLERYGPFHLAWLEALVRVSDWRASKKERNPQ